LWGLWKPGVELIEHCGMTAGTLASDIGWLYGSKLSRSRQGWIPRMVCATERRGLVGVGRDFCVIGGENFQRGY